MKNAAVNNQQRFQLLDLSYMKEISRGDLAYEKAVTQLFITTMPENLVELEKKCATKSYAELEKVLHYMQSSIAIMGLDKKLANFLDIDFCEQRNPNDIKTDIDFIISICTNAITEAKEYFAKLD